MKPREIREFPPNIPGLNIPRARKDPWRYTTPEPFIEKFNYGLSNSPSTPVSTSLGVEIYQFNNPECAELIETYVGKVAPNESNYLTALNRLYAEQGYVIVAKCSDQSVNHVDISSGFDCCERYLIIVEEDAKLSIRELTKGGNRVIECVLQEGSELEHLRLQDETPDFEFNHIVVKLKDRSNYELIQASRGGRLRRNEIEVYIIGKNTQVNLSGAWGLKEASHIDNQITVNHLAGKATSETRFHGIVHDESKAIFNGKIYVAPGAQLSDASLQNKNIATSEKAEIYTKPELELYADDIACSHGATSGFLDPEQLFYLRSRGIEQTEAETILLNSFLKEVVEDEEALELLGLPS